MPSLVGGGLFSADNVGDEKRTSFSRTGNLPSDDDDDDPAIAGAATVVDDDDVTSNEERITDFSFVNGLFSILAVLVPLLLLLLPTPAGVCHMLPPRDGPDTSPMAPRPPPV